MKPLLVALTLSLVASSAHATDTCSLEVFSFYASQLVYENATTQDDVDNVAAEIESQYDCSLSTQPSQRTTK